ncbi:MAG: hypothetical protein Q8N26_09405 [Myxococcales bacterium]|nr:hypothetical protein [Myxococcales bacterium]
MLLPVPRPRPLHEVTPWLALALVVWVAGLLVQRSRPVDREVELAGWQRSFRELPEAEQRTFRHLREALPELERLRVGTGQWPTPETMRDEQVEPFREDELTTPRVWTLRQHGVYASYVGVPVADLAAQRWVVVFIEPSTNEPAPPEDEEHHTRADGVPVHVTVWSQPNDAEPVPDEVLAFPAAQGFLQRVGR